MATHRPALSASLEAFAGQLLAEREVAPRAQVIVTEASGRLRAPVVVYLFDAAASPRWTSKASAGDIRPPAQCEALTLAMVAEQREAVLFAGHELVREHYAHLDLRRTVTSLAYAPLLSGDTLLGAVEAVSMDHVFTAADLAELQTLVELSARALAGAISYETERNGNFETITRITSFYDVEKTFHSTLQIERLLPIICGKTRELLPSGAANLWMVQDDALVLMARDGHDPTAEMGAIDDDVVKWIADKGKALLVRKADDPILKKRNAVVPGFVRGALAVPIVEGGALVGVLECINKDGAQFNEDDHFLLATIAETAAGALHNASLLEAEKKIEILETLVEVSQEITATLNLERVLQVLVNAPQRIMEYDRAAVALEERGKVTVKAISGKTEVVPSDPVVKTLAEMLEWSMATDEVVYITTTRNGQVVADREETRANFFEYFKTTGHRSWCSVPLADEQGRLGTLVFESKKNEFLGEAHFELIKVLAAQATVALRNASLYTEVRYVGVLQPILQKKQRFMAMDARRRAAFVAMAAILVLFLAVVPLPMRVQGAASVAPQQSAQVQAAEDGVVRTVYVREGDRVTKGTVLADMEDWNDRSAIAAAEAKRDAALSAMARALANNDGGEAGVLRLQADYWRAEVQRAKERLEHTRLRSPIDGIVATAYVENMVGRKLAAGDTFAQVVDTQHASADVAVDQSDLPLVSAGQGTSLKLNGFPTRKFNGAVTIVSPAATAHGDTRVFFARVDVPNPDGLVRAGMQGQAKVFVGWKPAGFVMFRGVGMWAWGKLWNWFGW